MNTVTCSEESGGQDTGRPSGFRRRIGGDRRMERVSPGDAPARNGSLERIHRFDRQATLERVVGYLAHNLGSPLNVIEGRAAMMASGELEGTESEVRRNARIIGEQSSRMARFLRDVVTFSRRQPETGVSRSAQTAADLGALATAAVAVLTPTATAQDAVILLELGGEEPAWVTGHGESLLLAITHVLENGIRATPAGGALTVRVREDVAPKSSEDPEGRGAPCYCIEVDDEGPGIELDMLPRLFQPFTTTREERQAVGLGLFIAQAIVKEHGGRLEGSNRSGSGARFAIYLPQLPHLSQGGAHAQ